MVYADIKISTTVVPLNVESILASSCKALFVFLNDVHNASLYCWNVLQFYKF